MTLELSGFDAKPIAQNIPIFVHSDAPLLRLSQSIDWMSLQEAILPDLKKTQKGLWYTGRKIQVRVHLGAYILQAMHNWTDRETEDQLRFNAQAKLFAGYGLVPSWHTPDATKIATFRSRLSRDTHHLLGEEIVKLARDAGFTNSEWMDVDSTVQEANTAYPSDASLIHKVAKKAAVVSQVLERFGQKLKVDLDSIAKKGREYFFAGRRVSRESKNKALKNFHQTVTQQVSPIIDACINLSEELYQELPKKEQELITLLCNKGLQVLIEAQEFIRTGHAVPGKLLSLCVEKIACIVKGKIGKKFEFGRVIQLGRIPGNFVLIEKSDKVLSSDKSAIPKMLYAHARIFGSNQLRSLATDKGYASSKNINSAKRAKVEKIGIQQPGNTKNGLISLSPEDRHHHYCRRAGVEPIIGHVKRGGLERSRMKSDLATEVSAYRSVLGYNCRTLLHRLNEVQS